jgi:hypothetical protein
MTIHSFAEGALETSRPLAVAGAVTASAAAMLAFVLVLL